MNISHEPSGYLFKQNSSNSIEYIKELEYGFYSNLNENDNSSDSTNYILNTNSNILKNELYFNQKENDNINNFIIEFQEKLKNLYYNLKFDDMINLLENENQNFLNNNKSFLFFIKKIKFFFMIKENRFEEAKQFYYNNLKFLLFEINNDFYKKDLLFQRLLKNNIFCQVDIIEKNIPEFEKELFNLIKNCKGIDDAIVIEKKINNFTFDRTKSDYLDFEDEINLKLNNEIYELNYEEMVLEKKINEINNNINNNNKINDNNINDNNEKKLLKKLPLISSFKAKYAKRETIDKKIIRVFKSFIIKLYKQKEFDPNNYKDYSFYVMLINGNILPPIDCIDVFKNEHIHFKSFNTNFLLWFFSKEGIKDLYNKFINIEGKNFIDNVSKHYKISESEKIELINYINNLPFIFDISLVNFPFKENFVDCKKNYNYSKGKNSKLKKYRSRDFEN